MTAVEKIVSDTITESQNIAFETAARLAELGIGDMEAQHASWREAFGKDCAQPYDDEIRIRREIAAVIRSLKK